MKQTLDAYAVSIKNISGARLAALGATKTAHRADGILFPFDRLPHERPRLYGATHSSALVERIRVRVAHGLPLVAMGISAVLSGSGEFDVKGSQASGGADVLIADVDAGLLALGEGNRHGAVLIVAQDDGEVAIRKALAGGARGFLLHTCAVDELTSAVKAVSRGGTAFAAIVASRIAESFASEQLTVRELEVLHLMVHGLSDKDMARKLVISLGTIKSHMKAILTKLGATRRTEAAAIAQRRGITRLNERRS